MYSLLKITLPKKKRDFLLDLRSREHLCDEMSLFIRVHLLHSSNDNGSRTVCSSRIETEVSGKMKAHKRRQNVTPFVLKRRRKEQPKRFLDLKTVPWISILLSQELLKRTRFPSSSSRPISHCFPISLWFPIPTAVMLFILLCSLSLSRWEMLSLILSFCFHCFTLSWIRLWILVLQNKKNKKKNILSSLFLATLTRKGWQFSFHLHSLPCCSLSSSSRFIHSWVQRKWREKRWGRIWTRKEHRKNNKEKKKQKEWTKTQETWNEETEEECTTGSWEEDMSIEKETSSWRELLSRKTLFIHNEENRGTGGGRWDAMKTEKRQALRDYSNFSDEEDTRRRRRRRVMQSLFIRMFSWTANDLLFCWDQKVLLRWALISIQSDLKRRANYLRLFTLVYLCW